MSENQETGQAPRTIAEAAHDLARRLALDRRRFFDAVLNIDGPGGREQWDVRMTRRESATK